MHRPFLSVARSCTTLNQAFMEECLLLRTRNASAHVDRQHSLPPPDTRLVWEATVVPHAAAAAAAGMAAAAGFGAPAKAPETELLRGGHQRSCAGLASASLR